MTDILNTFGVRLIREEVETNVRMVDHIACFTNEPLDTLLSSMNGVVKTLAIGQLSHLETRSALCDLYSFLLEMKLDVGDQHAFSLVSLSSSFAVGIQNILHLLPGFIEAAPVKEEEKDSLLFLLPNDTQPRVDASHVPHLAGSTATEETASSDSAPNSAMAPTKRVAPTDTAEERETSIAPVVKEEEDALLILLNKDDFSDSQVSREDDKIAEEEAPATESADNSQRLPPYQSQIQTPPAEGAQELKEPEEEDENIGGRVEEPADGAVKLEEPVEEEGKTVGGGERLFNRMDYVDNFNDGIGAELAVSPLSASSDGIRIEFRRHLRSVCSQLEPAEFSLDGIFEDVMGGQDDGGGGEAEAVEKDGEESAALAEAEDLEEADTVKSVERTLRIRTGKQNLPVTAMTDSEMRQLDESDSSSGSDSGSEYDEPAAKKRVKWPSGSGESPVRKQSKRARKQPLQQQKNRPLKSKARKILPKRSRRDSKGDEAEDAEDIEVDMTSGKTDDKQKCQLCGTERRHPSEHIAIHHLKKHLYTCPMCNEYGSGHCSNVVRHIRKVHPLDTSKRPISHVKELTAEIQRLQAICFPNLLLTVSRPPKYTHTRSSCMLCSEKVDDSHRQTHVFCKHFKKAALFDCPLCVSPRPTINAVWEHIRKYHQKDCGKVQPISHEKEFDQEISALNEKCFPGWKKRSSYGKKKMAAQKEDSESEEKNEAEEESEEESEWKGTKKNAKQTQAIKTQSKGRKTEAGEEDKGEMEEGEGGT